MASPEFPALIHDLALLSHLGIRLVLVYGIRAQIDALDYRGTDSKKVIDGIFVEAFSFGSHAATARVEQND